MIGRIVERSAFYLLLFAALALAAFLSSRYNLVWDASDRGRNTLSAASQRLLETLDAPLSVQVFIPRAHPLRDDIAEVLARYARLRPDIEVSYVDPDIEPALARQLGVSASGEIRLRYRDREEVLRTVSEEALSNAIQRLAKAREHLLLTLDGHGERGIEGAANHDWGAFGRELKAKGYAFSPINLTTHPAVPDNASLLVVASPQVPLLPGETALIVDYLQRGGNLLWLREPGEARGLAKVSSLLGIEFLPGVLVDANGANLGLDDPRLALAAAYPSHPATAGFELLTLFPHAAAMEITPREGWEAAPLIMTHSNSWNETGAIEGEIAPDRDEEQAGPLVLGVALARQLEGGEQRVVVIGDGDFLSNAYLGNGGNLDLGVNLVRWLAGEDALLEIPVRIAGDQALQLSKQAGLLIALFSLLIGPLVLFAGGLMVWRRRQRR